MSEVTNENLFAEMVRPYENQWIALEEKEGVRIIVGSGRSVEAVRDAEDHGHPDAVLFKVPSFSSTFIP